MTDEEAAGQVIAHEGSNENIALGDIKLIQTNDLSEEQIQELRMQHAKGMLDVHKKAQEVNVDIQAMDKVLGTLAEQTAAVSRAGDSVTITHSQSNSVGRTEVIMGNTGKAAEGKLSRSQTGESDNMMKYVLIAAAVIIVALIAFNA